ncbi:MAG TPA: hypothetical protein VMV45_05625 [Casimicrobiaceae bacterium]|nr:hypothetical protein [Casimicrobiaceae bacterium]
MTLRGSAFLALWNDVDPTRDDEYNAWHTLEHVPERVGIAGILAARRYVARWRTESRYFTLYELASIGVLASGDYVDVVAHPTQWTRTMRSSMRNFERYPCTTMLSAGIGIAAAISTFRFAVPLSGVQPDDDSMRSGLQSLLDVPGVASIHAGAAEPDPNFAIANQAPSLDDHIEFVVLVEATDAGVLDALELRLRSATGALLHGIATAPFLVYDLAFAIDKTMLADPTRARQPARDDLRARWDAGRRP